MSVIGEAMQANATYAKHFDLRRGERPTPKMAIVTCMDPRVTDILEALGLQPGDADIIRNAGSAVTEDTIRSLLVSTRLLGSEEIMIINHTDCGMQTFKDEAFHARLRTLTGITSVLPERFYAFTDPDENVREQIQKVRAHPWRRREMLCHCRSHPERGRIALKAVRLAMLRVRCPRVTNLDSEPRGAACHIHA